MFAPKVVQLPKQPGKYAVRKLTLRGWRYLNLHNLVTWHKASSSGFESWCVSVWNRATMARLLIDKPPL
jgi:hypothetical protein